MNTTLVIYICYFRGTIFPYENINLSTKIADLWCRRARSPGGGANKLLPFARQPLTPFFASTSVRPSYPTSGLFTSRRTRPFSRSTRSRSKSTPPRSVSPVHPRSGSRASRKRARKRTRFDRSRSFARRLSRRRRTAVTSRAATRTSRTATVTPSLTPTSVRRHRPALRRNRSVGNLGRPCTPLAH